MRAIRGATTVDTDRPDAIREATREMLLEMLERNDLAPTDIISAIFTVTPDLKSEFPAIAARELGWGDIALLCTTEIPVPRALARCIRVLMHVETDRKRDAIRHVYLRGAATLRPDLMGSRRES
jgi:chorismate mutase